MGLVINRKPQEAVEIRTPSGERITVRLIRARCGMARLLIEAPKECIIHREEVWQRQDREAQETPPPAA
jgi:carbon storage regulator CsrA